jgi:hypothetical protein
MVVAFLRWQVSLWFVPFHVKSSFRLVVALSEVLLTLRYSVIMTVLVIAKSLQNIAFSVLLPYKCDIFDFS